MGIDTKHDRLGEIWWLQLRQQAELELDPAQLTDVERVRVLGELREQFYEELVELARHTGSYRRHILVRSASTSETELAEDIADLLKCAIAIAQTLEIPLDSVVDAVRRKTRVVSDKAASARLELTKHTKVLCVDVDDCVCDLKPWRDVLNGDQPEDAPEKLKALEELKEKFYERGGFREMEPIEGAPAALRQLADAGFKIVYVTARPQWQYKRLYADTLDWLNQYNFPVDLLLFNKDKVEALYEHVVPAWPVAFVEDHPRNAIHLASVGVRVLMYDQPHNRDVEESENLKRVGGWADVLEEMMT